MNLDQPGENQQVLTLVEAADLLRTPVATLRYWRHRGIGPDGFRLGRRVVYRREYLDRWLTTRRDAEGIAADAYAARLGVGPDLALALRQLNPCRPGTFRDWARHTHPATDARQRRLIGALPPLP